MKIPIKNRVMRGVASALAVLVMIAAGLGVFYLIGSQFGLFGLRASPEKAGLPADILLGFITLLAIAFGLLVILLISLGLYGWIKKLYSGVFSP